MKKIIFAIEHLNGGGAERVTAALANNLCAEMDCEIHMIAYSRSIQRDYPTDNRIIWHEVSCLDGHRLERIFRRVVMMRQIIKKVKPDYVISLGTALIIAPLSVAMVGLKTPLILSERNDPKRFPVKKTHRILRTIYYTFCHALVFQTAEAQSFFPGYMQKKSCVICNPLTEQLPPRYEGIRENRIVNFCRLVPQKNLPLLIDAFSDIADAFPNYSLEIYGEGSEQAMLEEKIKAMNLENRVLLRSHSDTILDDIRKAALFVSSSDYEGISNSMLEAIALGIPTICTDCPAGGAREIIRNSENGLLVPTGNRRALADAMRTVLQNPVLAESMGSNGTALREQLHVKTIAKKWMMFIDQLSAV